MRGKPTEDLSFPVCTTASSSIVESELSRKLGLTVTLNFKDLQAADLSGRAVAFKKLVEGGVPSGEAFILASLEELQGTEN